jgi:hypothetical protein
MKQTRHLALVAAIALAFGAPVYAQSEAGSAAGATSGAQSGSQSPSARGGSQSSPQVQHGTSSATGTSAAGSSQWDAAAFDRLDTNGDGRISSAEAQADPMMRDHWTRMDSGNRGYVDRSGFEDYGRKLNPNTAYPKGHPFGETPKK